MPPRRGKKTAAAAAALCAQAPGADTLQAVFRMLDKDSDRRAALAVCKAWHAAMASDPSLWPTVVLRGPADLCVWDPEVARFNGRGGLEKDSRTAADVVSIVAAVSPRVQRVRLERFDVKPELVLACLAVLPASITRLDICTRCSGPLPAALARFTNLSSWGVWGDAGDAVLVDWTSPGCTAAVPAVVGKLTHLTLQYCHSTMDTVDDSMEAERMPEAVGQLLSSYATRLQALDVEAIWSPVLPQLCRSLTMLTSLRLGILVAFYHGGNDGGSDSDSDSDSNSDSDNRNGDALHQAVALLQELSHVKEITLCVDSEAGREDRDAFMDEEEWEESWEEMDTALPPLAGITNLVGLEVRQLAKLPPDWHSLTSLRRLSIMCRSGPEPQLGEELSKLTRLTHLSLGYHVLSDEGKLPAAVCELPALRSLQCVCKAWQKFREHWELQLPASFTKLTRLRKLRVQMMPLSEQSKSIVGSMPQLEVNPHHDQPEEEAGW